MIDLLHMETDANDKSIFPRSVIGVVGGGQLAQMLVEAGKSRGVDVIVQTKSKDDPAASIANQVLLSDPYDLEVTRELMKRCFCVTFENEWVNIKDLNLLQNKGEYFFPPLSALEPLVDKLSQRMLLKELGFPGPDWLILSSSELTKDVLPAGWQFPLMAKAATGGYDGKGTKVLKGFSDLNHLKKSVDPSKWLVEKWVPYERELALVVSRDLDGCIRSFPIAETYQSNQICDWVLAPAHIDHSVEMMAYNIASSLLVKLNYVGVLAIEFFYGPEGLLVNEVAPRTHNSAHFSIEACKSSQFDQQLCISAGLQVPETDLIVPGALMVNLLGLSEEFSIPLQLRLEEIKKIDKFNLHWYGKQIEKPGRKMAHVTVILNELNPIRRQKEAEKAIKKIHSIWPSQTTVMV